MFCLVTGFGGADTAVPIRTGVMVLSALSAALGAAKVMSTRTPWHESPEADHPQEGPGTERNGWGPKITLPTGTPW